MLMLKTLSSQNLEPHTQRRSWTELNRV